MGMIKLSDVCNIYQPQTISKKELVDNGEYNVYGANGIIGKYNKYNHEKSEVLLGCRGSCGSVNISEPYSWINGNSMVISPKGNNVNKKFLYYYLKSYDYSKVITGAVQKQITYNRLKDILFPEITIEQQEKIVNYLDNIVNMMELKIKLIDDYKQLIKSKFMQYLSNCSNYNSFGNYILNITKGPFGSDIKKSLYVPFSNDVYKVYIQINAIKKDQTLGDYWISNDYYEEKMKRFTVLPGDYIITCDGTLGKIYRLNEEMHKGIISASLLKITLDEKKIIPKYFESLWEYYMLPILIGKVRNAALRHLPSAAVIGKMDVPILSLELQKKYSAEIILIEKMIDYCEKDIIDLEKLFNNRLNELVVNYDS